MEQFILMDYHINWYVFILIILFTVSSVLIVFKYEKNIYKRLFYIIFFLLFIIYEGLGISVKEYRAGLYAIYYVIFVVTLSLSLVFFRKTKIKTPISNTLSRQFIYRYSDIIILLFLLISCIIIVYPENKLLNLIHPPLPDKALVYERMRTKEGSDFISFMKMLLMPFFYIVLYKYRHDKLKVFLFIFFPLYVTFCESAYIARNDIGLATMFFFIILYYYNPKKRKRYLMYFIGIIILFIPLSAAYMYMREGDYSQRFSIMQSIDLLFRVECSYPYWFDTIYTNAAHHNSVFEYTFYVILQPIPGFLKNIVISPFDMNSEISTLLTGLKKNDEFFFVPLSGLVSESVYIYGRYFFFIHAIFLGLILNVFLNFLLSKETFKLLLLYSMVYVAIIGPRAGVTTTMFYPFIIKTLFYVPLIISLLSYKNGTKLIKVRDS